MKLIKNSGNDRVVDELRKALGPEIGLDIASPAFSLFAFAELRDALDKIARGRLVLPLANGYDLTLLGSDSDRPFRNRLQLRALARRCADWIERNTELRSAPTFLPQSILITNHSEADHCRVVAGSCPFTTGGLGITPGNQFSLIQSSENADEWNMLRAWFTSLWNSLPDSPEPKAALLAALRRLSEHNAPSYVYYAILTQLFRDFGEELDEDAIVKSATGIRNTLVWKKLFKFQRDGVIGAIDKLNRFGGCIIADSVGLGKTFEALAIIKYHELRNDRVLVLCPKRLRDNWTL